MKVTVSALCATLLLLSSHVASMSLRTRSLPKRAGEEHASGDVDFNVGSVDEMMKSMTVTEAHQVLDGHLPQLIQQLLATRSSGPDAEPVAKEGLAPTSQPPCEKCKEISKNKKTADEALKVLNEMIKEEVREHDVIEKECITKVTKERITITTISEEIKSTETGISDAESIIADETGKLQEAELELEKIKDFLKEHETTCTTTITDLKKELEEIILQENAAKVLKDATTCVPEEAAGGPAEAGKGVSLMQCAMPNGASFITFTAPKLQRAHLLLGKRVNLSFLQAAPSLRGKLALLQSAEPVVPVMDPSNARIEEVAKRCKVNNPDDIIGTEGFLPKGPVPVNCGVLNDEFSHVHGEVKDERTTIEEHITIEETKCETVTKERTDEMKRWTDALNDANSKLSDALSDKTEDEGLLKDKLTTLHTEELELETTTTECREQITHVLTRICSIQKLREELDLKPDGAKLPPQDCKVGTWLDGECQDPNTGTLKTCGGGVQTRTRAVLIHAKNGGMECPALSMNQPCNEDPCPVSCVQSSWSTWGSCSSPCNGGVQMRSRTTVTDASGGGEPCGEKQEEQVCNTGACKPQQCVLGEFGDWGPCSKACMADAKDLPGRQERHKKVLVPGSPPEACPPEGSLERSEARLCNQMECPERPQCVAKLDLVVNVDSSGSIGAHYFANAVEFVKHLVGRFVLGAEGTDVAVLSFADSVNVIQPLGGDKVSVDAAVGGMQYTRGSTNTAAALSEARALLQNGRQDAASVVLTLTDGSPDSQLDAAAAADKLKADGARLFFVMVNRFLPLADLKELASSPADSNVLRVQRYDQLENALRQILVSVCPIVEQAAAPAQSCAVTGEHLPMPDSGMLLVNAEDQESSAGTTVEDGESLHLKCKMGCQPDRVGALGQILCDNGLLGPLPSNGPQCNCDPPLPPVAPPADMPALPPLPESEPVLPPGPPMPEEEPEMPMGLPEMPPVDLPPAPLPPAADMPPDMSDLPFPDLPPVDLPPMDLPIR